MTRFNTRTEEGRRESQGIGHRHGAHRDVAPGNFGSPRSDGSTRGDRWDSFQTDDRAARLSDEHRPDRDEPHRNESRREIYDTGRFGWGERPGHFVQPPFDPRHPEPLPGRFGPDQEPAWRDTGYGVTDSPYRDQFRDERDADRYRGKGPKGYQRSDERIREDVCDGLTYDPRIDAEGIEITVRQGEVKLEGTVPVRAMKRAAEDLAETVAGVREVINFLRVKQPIFGDSPVDSDPSRSSPPNVASASRSSTARTGH